MNKKRLLELIRILRTGTDMDHKLSIAQIISMLEESGIPVSDRKTIYDDLKVLNEYGFEVEYDSGYYLTDAPFSVSEIKIITDSLNSLKNLDEVLLERTKEKLYSFISEHEASQLRKLEYHSRHSDRKFINRLEDVLEAIRNERMLRIRRKGHDEELIAPVFLHRQNDYYYLYYHYPGNGRIYHLRFDNILNTDLSETKNDIRISSQKIIEHIFESTNSYSSGKTMTVRFLILEDSEYLRMRLTDDFPNLVFTKDGFSLKAAINDVFFSKLTSYGDKIKISDRDIADQYISYLDRIATCNR